MSDSIELKKLNPVPRRRLMEQAACGLLGVSIGPSLMAADAIGRKVRARRVISLFMSGGMAQHETFSPCPDAPADIRGEELQRHHRVVAGSAD